MLHRTVSTRDTWFTLFVLILLHLGLNYKYLSEDNQCNGRCVKSVVLININRQRASIILSYLFDENLDPKPLNNIPTPVEVSKREKLFTNNKLLGHPNHTADIGVSSVSVFNLMRGTPSSPYPLLHQHSGTVLNGRPSVRSQCRVRTHLLRRRPHPLAAKNK